jgi:hypothetical protein
MDGSRPKRKSSSGVAEAVRRLQKKSRTRNLQVEAEQSTVACAVCNKTNAVTVNCSICELPLHRLCSNDVLGALSLNEDGAQIEDLGNRSFCSRKCYDTYHLVSPRNSDSGRDRTAQRELLWIDQMEEEKTEEQLPVQLPSFQFSSESEVEEDTSCLVMSPSASADDTLSPSELSDEWIMKEMVCFTPTEEDWMDNKLYKTVGSTLLQGKVTQIKLTKKNDPTTKQYLVRCQLHYTF